MNSRLFAVGIIISAFLVIRCNDPASPGGEEPYTVKADIYEPDNVMGNAKRIYPDSAAQERTLKRGDIDYALLTTEAGKTYKIFTSGNVDTKIQIFNLSSTVPILEGDDSPGNPNASVTLISTSYGTYYIGVSGADETVIGAYTLSVITSVGPDSYESDSLPQASRTITNNSSQSRTLMQKDVDWVRFTAASNDTLIAAAAGTCPIRMFLFDRDTITQIASSAATDSVAILNYKISIGGTYFIKIVATDSLSEGSYTLSLGTGASSNIVVDDAYEDDNTLLTAKTIPGSSLTQKRSLTYRDTDWVKIPVIMGRQYTISFSNSYARGYLCTKDGTYLQGPSTSLSLNSSATDTIYVKIYSTNTVRINYDLNLTVLLQPGVPDQYETDNTREQAKAKCYSADSLLQDRTLPVVNSVSDTDWVAFIAQAGKNYTIKAITSTSTTIYMYLYDDNSASYLRSLSSTSSYITYTPSVTDTLYLMAYRPSSYTSIAYTLSVQGVYQNDSFEPDSSRATAKSISTGAQSRVILPSDTDWVMYTATAGDSFAVLTTGSTDTKIALFTSSGLTPILENDDFGGNKNGFVSMKSEFGGQFYIRVTGKTYGPYVLQVLSVMNGTLVQPDTFENDNSKASATIIKDTVSISQIHSLSANDTDWIALPVLAGGVYSVSAYSSTNYLSLHGYTSLDSLIGSSVSTINASVSTTPLKNDTLYFRVSSSYTIAQYTLTVSRTAPPAPDAYEIDNTKDKAFKATGSFTSQSRTITVGDTDWISIPVLAGGKYVLSSNVTSLRIVLFNSSGTQLSYTTSGSLTFTASAADTFYYLLTSASPQSIPTIRYTLSMAVDLPLAADSYENDNTISSAKSLPTDSTVQDRTITISDTDFVSLRLQTGGRLTITAAHSTSNYTYLHLYDSTNVLLTNKYTTSGGTSLSYTFSTAGLYYCRIISQPSSSYSYRLSAKLTKMDTLTVEDYSSKYLSASDTQWVAVALESNKQYTIQTASSMDTRIWLYDSVKATSYRATDDNSGINNNGMITYTPIRSGYFFVRITAYPASASANFILVASDSLAKTDAAGVWDIEYTWSNSVTNTSQLNLNIDGSFTINNATQGIWTQTGNILILSYSGGAVYSGKIAGTEVSGIMINSTNNGTWSGTKKSE